MTAPIPEGFTPTPRLTAITSPTPHPAEPPISSGAVVLFAFAFCIYAVTIIFLGLNWRRR